MSNTVGGYLWDVLEQYIEEYGKVEFRCTDGGYVLEVGGSVSRPQTRPHKCVTDVGMNAVHENQAVVDGAVWT